MTSPIWSSPPHRPTIAATTNPAHRADRCTHRIPAVSAIRPICEICGIVNPGQPTCQPDAASALPEPARAGGQESAAPVRFDGGRLGDELRDELGGLYLVLILGGLAAFAAASILRQKGVDRSWTS